MARKKSNVIKYRKPVRFNIGVLIFLFIFIYIIVITLNFMNQKRISIYEVTEKMIADDNTCQGVILRKEELIQTEKEGYVNYYVGDGKRVGKGSLVLSVDAEGNSFEKLAGIESEERLTSNEISEIRSNISFFQKNNFKSNYSSIATLKYDMDNTILQLASDAMIENMENLLSKSGTKNTLNTINTKKSGIITYSMDGYEDLKKEDITSDLFKAEGYSRTQLRKKEKIKKGTPVYKLITDENWSMVLSLSEEQYKILHEKEIKEKEQPPSYVTITITKDDLKVTAPYETFKKGNDCFAVLNFTKYMVHYINDRFLEVELTLNTYQGYKIPNTSILEKTFIKVPIAYFTKGENDNNGLIKESYDKNGEVIYEFIETTIFYSDEKFGFIDSPDLEIGNWIQNEKTKKRYQLAKTGKLEGVYNVNKGYAVFRRVEPVYKNKEYCIIKKDTAYGLSSFDHIVVDASAINEDDIIK